MKDDSPNRSDNFVSRAGPGWKSVKGFQAGQLGVLLTSYGREPLFLAYRNLTLDAAALQQQASAALDDHDPPSLDRKSPLPPTVGVSAWLAVRNEIVEPLQRPIATEKNYPDGGFGSFINCGDPAFDRAATALTLFAANRQASKESVLAWIEAQDTVFATCGNDAAPALEPLPVSNVGSMPHLLHQLRNYQIAAQHFYAGRFDAAVAGFDRYAKVRTHPMWPWGGHSAVRAIVRKASLDNSFARKVLAIRASADADEQKAAQLAAARQEDAARRQAAFAEVERRIQRILADESLVDTHAAGQRLLRQAKQMLVPEQLFAELTAVLARFDRDPVRSRDLDLWVSLADRLFDYGGGAATIAAMRSEYPFFDWIRTIQGCTDNPRSPNFTGKCADEHAHAMDRWSSGHGREWLVAALMTAGSIGMTPSVAALLREVDRVAPDSPEFLTVRYHAIKLHRRAGQTDHARHLLVSTVVALKSGQARAADDSAANLLRQEGFALARNATEAIHFIERAGPQPAADVDEWLNRRLGSDDLLALAQTKAVAPNLRHQLLVAAWWRAELAGKADVAVKAAQAVGDAMPNLQPLARAYVAAPDADERAYAMARAAVSFRLSPRVLAANRGFAGKPKPVADYWCSFDSNEYVQNAQAQRVPAGTPLLVPPSADQARELAGIARQGTALEWLARIARSRQEKHPADPDLKSLLATIAKSDQLWCRTTLTDAAVQDARAALGRLGSK